MRLDNAMDESCMEVLKLGTNPLNLDRDGDGLLDGSHANTHKPSWSYVKRYRNVYEMLNKTWGGWLNGLGENDTGTNLLIAYNDTVHDGIDDCAGFACWQNCLHDFGAIGLTKKTFA